jgi:integrase
MEEMPDNLKLIVLLASWCACRFGELVELRRNDIDLADEVIHIRRAAVRVEKGWKVGDPKSEAGKRDVAIPPHIIPAVTRHLAKHVDEKRDSLLFPAKNGGHLQPSTLGRHFDRARIKAKRPDLRFHDLRHSGAVLAAQTDASGRDALPTCGTGPRQADRRAAVQTRREQLSQSLLSAPHFTERQLRAPR